MAWGLVGAFLLGAALALRQISGRFAYDVPFQDMPILGFVAGYIAVAAVLMLAIPWLVRATPAAQIRSVLVLILVVGLAARLSQLGAVPLLEDDYYRYLWDGAVTSIGHSPFAHAPLDLLDLLDGDPEASGGNGGDPALAALAAQGAAVLERVNYPEYRTVYPPALQAVFAAAHWVAPFSLEGWRVILLGFELGCAGLIWAMLVWFHRSPLWLALYWWNPLVIKEIANSAHMEPVLILPVLLAAYAVLRRRVVVCAALLAIGAGIKLWPAILGAALVRARWVAPWQVWGGAGVMAGLLALQLWPILAAGLDDSSGFVAFGKEWRASSAVILVAQAAVAWLPGEIAQNGFAPRLVLGAVLALVLILICARRPALGPETTVYRMFLITAALYLLSPSTTPWYFLWIAPFLCLFPVRGLILAGVSLPLHYLYFHLSLLDRTELYRSVVVWVIWAPVWGLLIWEFWRGLRHPGPKDGPEDDPWDGPQNSSQSGPETPGPSRLDPNTRRKGTP